MAKRKRFYKIGEFVWVKPESKVGKVKTIDKENLEATVVIKDQGITKELILKLWEIDKLKYKAKAELMKRLRKTKGRRNRKQFILYFAKVRPDAIIPTKRVEDAGYDVYANLEPRETEEGIVYEMLLKKGEVNFIPTGIASYMSDKYYLNLSNERSSVAKLGLVVLAGCIDSKYQGEIMVMAIPLVKDILITNQVDEVEETEDMILYPYKKAIAQATLLPVPKVKVKEITYEELKSKPSQRKDGGWGSSGK